MTIQLKLEKFIKKKTRKKITNETNLIAENIIDSFEIIKIASFVEDNLRLKCPINKISTANFNNISLITKFIKKYNKSK
jgi:acyl carrier protein